MTVSEALSFFDELPRIKRKLKALNDVGLGYIKLGQQATTLSGGEAQRVKLATELSKVGTGKTLYILDEPTTGLHFEDVNILLKVLNKLVDKGNTVVVVEHNLDVIKTADMIIDMGPGGGDDGGKIIARGTPEEIMKNKNSLTGAFLKKEIKTIH
jgi:excinuclease ABC subunit A